MIADSYYYDNETVIFTCFDNLKESEKTSGRDPIHKATYANS